MALYVLIDADGVANEKQLGEANDLERELGGVTEYVPLPDDGGMYVLYDLLEEPIENTRATTVLRYVFPLGDTTVHGPALFCGEPDEHGHDTDCPEWLRTLIGQTS